MQLHQIKRTNKQRGKKRIGRGGKRGTYSGRGIKGQKTRAGRQMVPPIRQLIKKYPKLRGYRFKPTKQKPSVVNVGTLEQNFRKGDLILPKVLLEKKLIRRIKGRLPKVKILGMGKLTKKLIIEDCKVSENAKKKIEKAKGVIK